MNIEEKARAYDEALERCKEWASGTWGHSVDDSPKDIAEFIFPQLAESEDESEDERIRKALIEVFKEKLERGFEWVEYGIPNRSVLSWLEKQKEQKHPNGCFTCDEYKKGYEEGRRNGFTAGYNKAMKEMEQKEPHFTKRNALFDKCVENCNPEIMKRVSDEVDEMLEKEQKLYWKPTNTDVALLNKAIITNNTLTSTEREQLDIIRSRFGYCRASNCNGIVQEKPNSSECSDDERIREDIIALIKFALEDGSAVSPGSYTTKEEALAYLEKQKKESLRDFIDNFPYSAEQEEQDWNKKPCLTCQEYEKGHKQGYTEGCTAGYNKAMKERTEEILGLDGNPICYKQKPADYNEYKMLIDGAREHGRIEGRKEVIDHPEEYGLTKQKLAEWSEEIIQKAVKEVGLTQHQIDWFKTNVFPPKVEWSEEDEGELQNAIDALEFLGKKGVYKSESGYDAALQAASWLKDLPERFNFQPKQEWSEEDEKMLEGTLMWLDDLKKQGEYVEKERLWLKSLRPQSHWKPSKEQMTALYSALNDAISLYSNEISPSYEEISRMHFDVLESLYNDLKKL